MLFGNKLDLPYFNSTQFDQGNHIYYNLESQNELFAIDWKSFILINFHSKKCNHNYFFRIADIYNNENILNKSILILDGIFLNIPVFPVIKKKSKR